MKTKDNILKFAYGKIVGGLVALGMLFVFIVLANPVLSYIGTTFGINNAFGGFLSLEFLFGWIATLIIVPIHVARKLKYASKDAN